MKNQKTQLIIARHGNTFAPEDIIRRVGKTDLPLVAKGIQQGQKLGVLLKEKHLIPDVVYTSCLKRTIQTAEQALSAMGIKLPAMSLEIFDEIDYGPDENQPEDTVVRRIGQAQLKAWEEHAIVPKGWCVNPETMIQNWQNFSESVLQNHYGQTVLVVTSNGIARFAPHLTGDFMTFAAKHSIKLSTGAYGLLEYDHFRNGWRCSQWNVKP